jgi:hypothetical protein
VAENFGEVWNQGCASKQDKASRGTRAGQGGLWTGSLASCLIGSTDSLERKNDRGIRVASCGECLEGSGVKGGQLEVR